MFCQRPGKKPNRLPRIILTPEDVRRILVTPDTNTDSGYRDRVILEILYDTAIRRAELSSILISHLDLEDGYIHIRGKGNRHRVVQCSCRNYRVYTPTLQRWGIVNSGVDEVLRLTVSGEAAVSSIQ